MGPFLATMKSNSSKEVSPESVVLGPPPCMGTGEGSVQVARPVCPPITRKGGPTRTAQIVVLAVPAFSHSIPSPRSHRSPVLPHRHLNLLGLQTCRQSGEVMSSSQTHVFKLINVKCTRLERKSLTLRCPCSLSPRVVHGQSNGSR